MYDLAQVFSSFPVSARRFDTGNWGRVFPSLRDVAFSSLRLERLSCVVNVLVIVETGNMTQVFASRAGNVGGIDIGGWDLALIVWARRLPQ